ncbi:response regulator [Rhizobiaceae bacterium n13]|uniref:response regulator transcription factor n=1 Tax=Ferirhizobium litorale TaxID=2927786 RepID=UPI0024B2B1DC|nr:response regulator [Fererhizobium litorale]MDI7864220.1 response regulator [Fererhizobium litorale]
MTTDTIQPSPYPVATAKSCVLIADAEVTPASALVERLIRNGLEVCLADSADAAKRHLRERAVSFAIIELVLEDCDGLDLVADIARAHPQCRTLVHSRFCNLSNAVQAVKSGASDVLPKPTDVDFLVGVLLNRDMSQRAFPPSLPAPDSIRGEHIRDIFMSCDANVSRAARQLSMHRKTLERFLKRSALL